MDNKSNLKALNNNLFLGFLVGTRYRPYRHLILIIFIALGFSNAKGGINVPFDTYLKAVSISILLSLFYVNMYILVPRLLLRDRYMEYSVFVVVLICFAFCYFLAVRHYMDPYVPPLLKKLTPGINVFGIIFLFTVLVTASTAIKLFQRWVVDSRRLNELEKTAMQSELEQLKNQITPHFLFNMLNNANVLTKRDPEKASELLMRLSDLLRYQLYDSARNKVFLTSDIRFLEDFLALENIRRDNFDFVVSKEGGINGVQISPLLLVTFVENAVKHNMDAEKKSYVHLFFDVQNGTLHFDCINSKPRFTVSRNGVGGLGLANVKRRLELLYPGRHGHTLRIEDGRDTYTIKLTIRL